MNIGLGVELGKGGAYSGESSYVCCGPSIAYIPRRAVTLWEHCDKKVQNSSDCMGRRVRRIYDVNIIFLTFQGYQNMNL